MRYRALDANGNYQFGLSDAQFLVNTPAAVAQAAQTRFQLRAGEWFLDTTEGMPYDTRVLGKNTQALCDDATQERLAGTPGVLSIDAYASVLDNKTRALTVTANVTTVYGTTIVNQVLP